MARRKTGDKSTKIRQATVDEVVEKGSSAASINAIAKRAGLAVGTLYRYHDDKEALLGSVYLTIKAEIHDAMMSSAAEPGTSRDKIKAMWFAILDHASAHPRDFLFVEVIMNGLLLTKAERTRVNEMAAAAGAVIDDAIAEGVLRPCSTDAIRTLLIAPAMHIGRRSALDDKEPDMVGAEEIFDLCWQAIATPL